VRVVVGCRGTEDTDLVHQAAGEVVVIDPLAGARAGSGTAIARPR
jgi:hypothetical protein